MNYLMNYRREIALRRGHFYICPYRLVSNSEALSEFLYGEYKFYSNSGKDGKYMCRTDIFPDRSSFTFLSEDFYYSVKESVFVAVQDSCTYAGTNLCLNDHLKKHYLCKTFCLGWTIHNCNATPYCSAFSGKSQYLRIFSMPSYLPNQLYLSYGFCFKDNHVDATSHQ